ncbi:MAG: biosynthetic peptidoglycan transglycosylase [Syntrophothermus sp.]
MQFQENELSLIYNWIAGKFQQRKFLVLSLYIFTFAYLSVPSFTLPLLEYNRTRISSVMEQRAIEKLLFFYPAQSWTGYSDINPNFMRSVVAMEDGRFFIHKGIDWEELEKSMQVNKKKRKMARGGSTITMQLSKNLFLRTDKNIFRKAKELLITMRMEKEVGKKAILENYFNVVEWGDGIFGIGEAADVYYHKKPSELNINESANLAAVIPSPLLHKPTDNSRYVRFRASLIKARYNGVSLP